MNMTDKLAEALREAQAALDSVAQPGSLQLTALLEANAVLAQYDAQREKGPACGHSACSQHYIDTGSRECVEAGEHTDVPWQVGETLNDDGGTDIVIARDPTNLGVVGMAWDRDDARHIVACVNACQGIDTAQLEAMNAIDLGLLASAYDVCSDLWDWFGIELVGDHPIAGSEAVDALCQVADNVEAVVQWAREEGALQ